MEDGTCIILRGIILDVVFGDPGDRSPIVRVHQPKRHPVLETHKASRKRSFSVVSEVGSYTDHPVNGSKRAVEYIYERGPFHGRTKLR